MKRILIGTPSYDGKVDVWFANSLVNTVLIGITKQIQIMPIYMAYDSLVQRARNDLVKIALENECDDLIFIDSDIEWNPEWIFKLLDYDVDVVGGIYPKKNDITQFPIKYKSKETINGLMEVDALATGFLKISKNALQKVWDNSLEYQNEGKTCRMVFDIQIVDGNLVSEDIIFCQKWQNLGGKIYLDPTMNCNHIGIKKYQANFEEYLKTI